MPRGRMLNKKISLDERVALLSAEAALLFTWMIPHTDCEGKMLAIPETIKGNVCPFLRYISINTIKNCLQQMANADLIKIYGDGKYLIFNSFDKNQIINTEREAPSIIPNPDQLKSNSGVTPDQLQSNSLLNSKIQNIKYKDKDIRSSSDDHDAFLDYLEFNFGEIWKRYPRREGKKQAFRYFKASVKSSKDWVDITSALENYLKNLSKKKIVDTQYIQKGSTWFNNWQDWIQAPDEVNEYTRDVLKGEYK